MNSEQKKIHFGSGFFSASGVGDL